MCRPGTPGHLGQLTRGNVLQCYWLTRWQHWFIVWAKYPVMLFHVVYSLLKKVASSRQDWWWYDPQVQACSSRLRSLRIINTATEVITFASNAVYTWLWTRTRHLPSLSVHIFDVYAALSRRRRWGTDAGDTGAGLLSSLHHIHRVRPTTIRTHTHTHTHTHTATQLNEHLWKWSEVSRV